MGTMPIRLCKHGSYESLVIFHGLFFQPLLRPVARMIEKEKKKRKKAELENVKYLQG